MLRALRAWLAARVGRRSGDGETDADDEAWFVRSRLDASVLFAHGQGNAAERELADVEEQAEVYRDLDRER